MGTLRRAKGSTATTLMAVALAGCWTAPVQIEYETDGHLPTSTGERLYKVRATEVSALYLKPGIYFSSYHSVAVRPVALSYAEPPAIPTVYTRKPGNFRLRLGASDRIRRELRDALISELHRDGGWRVVPEPQPTPGGLVVYAHIVGLRWETPPELGSESLYVRRTGVMGLQLDLRDTQTGALLARISDARAIKPMDVGAEGAFESSPVNNWAGVRNVCTRWGWVLRETLASLRQLPPLTIQ